MFIDRDHPDACGLHTVLSAWHLKGRDLAYIPHHWLRQLYGAIGYDWQSRARAEFYRTRPAVKPKHHLAVLLSRLSHDDAVRHWKRLDQLGAFNHA